MQEVLLLAGDRAFGRQSCLGHSARYGAFR